MFYGWWIVASVFVAQMFMVGFLQYAFPFVLVAVKEEFAASATEANLAMTVSGGIGLLLSPVIGSLADRWSARWLVAIGGLLFVIGLVMLSFTQGIELFVAVFAIMISAANILQGPITGQAIVSRWFTAGRGRALGIAAVGTSVGGLVLPVLVSYWIEIWDWRVGLRALAGLVTVSVLPLAFFVLRDHPADKGLQAESASETVITTDPQNTASGREWSNGEILRSRSFWVIGLSLGLLFMSYTGFLSNVGLYVDSLNLRSSVGTTVVFLVALFGLIGKLLLGAATDRIGLRLGLWIALGLAAAGIGVFSTEPSEEVMWLAATLLGLAAGGMLPVWAGMVARCFGTASFGRVMGVMSPLIALLVMPGFMIAGWSADTTGSYSVALQIYLGAIGLSSLLLFALDLGDDESPTSGE